MSGAGREGRLRELLEAGLDAPAQRRRSTLEALSDDPALVDEALAMLDDEAALGGFLEVPAADALGREGADPDFLDTAAEGPRPAGGPHGTGSRGTGSSGSGNRAPGSSGSGSGGSGSGRTGTGGVGADDPSRPPPTIPGYHLERLLGEGGMGRVYQARQDGPGARTVAVKLVRSGLLHSHAAARFPVEQQALARLNHPAIAQLYTAATTPDGQPYVVMEHVDGEPITRFADQHRLSVEDRLQLFVEVCRGVEHAHRRQLLHRDLKPSNLLVTEEDGTPHPKIIDFGIARILDDPLDADGRAEDGGAPLTGMRLVGTPQYMSPEARDPVDGARDLDTRTDVYSLGVVLYELLTGGRPSDGGTASGKGNRSWMSTGSPGRGPWDAPRPSTRLTELDEDTRRTVESVRSTEPGSLARRLKGDLDWIVMKALAPDREERYGSAAELARDVERSLSDQPVLARPPSIPYRLAKLARRHKLAAALTLLTVLALVAATVLTSMALVRATRAERTARAEAAAAGQTLDLLVDLFEAASPSRARGEEVSARDLVDRGIDELDAQALPPLQRARLLHTLADVQLNLGDFDDGSRLAREALELRQAGLAPHHPDVLDSIDLLGTLERRAGRLEAAEPLMERLLAAAEEGADEDPRRLGDALNSLANLRWRQRRLEESTALHRRALELRREIVSRTERGELEPREEGTDPSPQLDVASSLNNLGVLLWNQGNLEEAEPYLREAQERFAAELGSDHPRVAAALTNRGNILQDLGRYAETEAVNRQALAICEKVLGPDHPQTSAALHNLARALDSRGRHGEAEAAYRRSLEIRRRAFGPDHAETLRTEWTLANMLRRQERFSDAEAVFAPLLARCEGQADTQPRRLAATLYRYGQLRRQVGSLESADSMLGRAADLYRSLEEPKLLADVLHERRLVEEARGGASGARNGSESTKKQNP